MILISLFALLLSLSSSATACSTELDVDFRGVTRPNDLSYSRASSFQECCAKCDAEPRCQAWTFVFDTTVCWLKTEVGYRLPTLGRISGLKSTSVIPSVKTCTLESGYVYNYNDITLPLTLATPADCCARCGQTSGCVAWSYLSDYHYCYLKNALPIAQNRVAYQNSFSGVVNN